MIHSSVPRILKGEQIAILVFVYSTMMSRKGYTLLEISIKYTKTDCPNQRQIIVKTVQS